MQNCSALQVVVALLHQEVAMYDHKPHVALRPNLLCMVFLNAETHS